MKKRTSYVLITLEQYTAMVQTIEEYQHQHAEKRDDWRKHNDISCGCQACMYAEQTDIHTAKVYAPIFIPEHLPWHESEGEA